MARGPPAAGEAEGHGLEMGAAGEAGGDRGQEPGAMAQRGAGDGAGRRARQAGAGEHLGAGRTGAGPRPGAGGAVGETTGREVAPGAGRAAARKGGRPFRLGVQKHGDQARLQGAWLRR